MAKQVSPQPKTYDVSLKNILSFPFRVCNPPPSVGKVRSCTLTPLLKVRLEDVLDRKHLPPLGLKDFEEWLLFVELSPENLYFTLWLREYRLRYNQWKSQASFHRDGLKDYPLNWAPQYSSNLALFYTRAKQTFLTPNGEYELNLPSSLLAPFHKANMPPHPDPDVFNPVAVETFRMLDESLKRFVLGQLNNVGNQRVLCGMIAGAVLMLVGAAPPLIVNFVRGHDRWLRLTALPGVWLGLTIFLAALSGMCVGVYAFGDLRQLRKFELSRPTISKPQPLPHPTRWLQRTETQASTDLTRVPSDASGRSRYTNSYAETEPDNCDIQISPMYYDDDPVDGPAYSDSDCRQRLPETDIADVTSPTVSTFIGTASFIHPFEISDDESELNKSLKMPQRNQPIHPFNFDSLPKRHNGRGLTIGGQFPFAPEVRLPAIPEPARPKSWLARFQERCTISKRRLQLGMFDSFNSASSPHEPYQPPSRKDSLASVTTGSQTVATKAASSVRPSDSSEKQSRIRKRFRMMKAVPAFAVPLTRVLSPVVARGQWEIVVRSSLTALVLSIAFLAAIVAIPPRK